MCVPVRSSWQEGSCRAGLQLGRLSSSSEEVPSSVNTVHYHVPVFPAPAWVCCWAANTCAVDSLAGSVKQDTLTPGTSPDTSAVIFPALPCLCTRLTAVTARGPSLLSALNGKAGWVSHHSLFAVGLRWKRPFSLFHPVAVLSFLKEWNWKIFLFCTVLL